MARDNYSYQKYKREQAKKKKKEDKLQRKLEKKNKELTGGSEVPADGVAAGQVNEVQGEEPAVSGVSLSEAGG